MIPAELRTPRLTLDQPTIADVPTMVEYCRDPMFERFMVTPWPYEPQHAESFILQVVSAGWEHDQEYTWAMRTQSGGQLLGTIGWRRERSEIGYWMGAPHRGSGYVTEGLRATTEWILANTDVDAIRWWAKVGNYASARVARSAGFRYLGSGASPAPDRGGTSVPAWTAEFRRGDEPDARTRGAWSSVLGGTPSGVEDVGHR